jgi:hypothetical protein
VVNGDVRDPESKLLHSGIFVLFALSWRGARESRCPVDLAKRAACLVALDFRLKPNPAW